MRSLSGTLLASLALGTFAPGTFAALSIYVPPEGLAARAPVVLTATVEQVSAGRNPETGVVATYIELEVERVHRGPELERLTLREAGGIWEGEGRLLDSVPVFESGERVLLFLTVGHEGLLRTYQHGYGKFVLAPDADGTTQAWRDLGRAGTVGRRADAAWESFEPRELLRAVAAADPEQVLPLGDLRTEPEGIEMAPPPPSDFILIDPAYRWTEPDSGSILDMDVDRSGNPLGNGLDAVEAMRTAFDAWNDETVSRLEVIVGDDDSDFSDTQSQGPLERSPNTPGNGIILFDDPYDDMDDPIVEGFSCSGTLAVGGSYFSTFLTSSVNGETFFTATKGFIIFNRNWDGPSCFFLDDSDNLSEVAAHEMGHVVGLGHSETSDAVMRAFAYGDRGARLGTDDVDAVHCTYPHTVDLFDPDGGESLTGGQVFEIQWTTTSDMADPGVVDLQYSTNGGSSWIDIETGVANSGSFDWTVPSTVTSQARVRVHRPLIHVPPSPFPDSCTDDQSASNFSIAEGAPTPGETPQGSRVPGTPLELARDDDDLVLTWGESCGGADAYAVYQGTLDSLQQGVFDHAPSTCAANGTSTTLATPTGMVYYLVVPVSGPMEGLYGEGSEATARPASSESCAPQDASQCPQ